MSLLTFYFLTVLRTPSFFWSVRSIMFLVRTHPVTFRNIDAVCLLFLSLLFAVFISTLILASRCHIPFIFFSFSCFFFFSYPRFLPPCPTVLLCGWSRCWEHTHVRCTSQSSRLFWYVYQYHQIEFIFIWNSSISVTSSLTFFFCFFYFCSSASSSFSWQLFSIVFTFQFSCHQFLPMS